MKKTLITYTIIFIILSVLLYFLSMSWMNFLYRPNLKKELEILVTEMPRQHPFLNQNQRDNFIDAVDTINDEIGLFTSHFKYFEKLAPAFTCFEDTFTYLDFWEGSLHSASVLPMIFKYRGGETLVKRSLGNVIPAGSVITGINEKSIDEILNDFGLFIYAETDEERRFWVAERDLLNYYPEFFKANQYQIQYIYDGTEYNESIEKIFWKEFSSWKTRVESKWYDLKRDGDYQVLKIYDLSYSEENNHEIRKVMNDIITSNCSKLMIDLTDAKGEGGNYYNLQLLLSFLTDQEGYLIKKQVMSYITQTDAFSVFPQKENFQGKLYFLISEYSIYPYIRALISFCKQTETGIMLGTNPLSDGDYFSNPNREPLYFSYLIPKVCRTLNVVKTEDLEGVIDEQISFTQDDYWKLMTFEKDYSDYFPQTD